MNVAHSMKPSNGTIAAAFALSGSTLVLGYVLLGVVPMLLFSLGFVGGLAFWLLESSRPTFRALRAPYWLTLVLFVAHKLEERYLEFFPALSRLTGVPVPDTSSLLVYLLYAAAATWLAIPYLVNRHIEFGYYLAWTFFTSMGVIELAHFAFPLFTDAPYGYFPGMATVIPLAPSAWWGLARLRTGSYRR